MKTHWIRIGEMATILTISLLSACHHKSVCRRLADKNRACATAFERYVETKADQWMQSHPIPGARLTPARNSAPKNPRTIGTQGAGAATGAKPTGHAASASKDDAAGSPAARRAAAMRLMRAKRREKAKQEIRELFTGKLFLETCHRAWAGNQKEDRRLKKAAEDCLAVTDCDAYVACIMDLKRKRQTSGGHPGD